MANHHERFLDTVLPNLCLGNQEEGRRLLIGTNRATAWSKIDDPAEDKFFRRRFPLHVMEEMPPEGCEWLLATHYPALVIVPSIVSFRRDLFEKVGGFPPVRYEEDVALFSLLLREGGVSPGEGGRSFKQVPFVGAWLDWLRDGYKVSTEMHTTQKPRLLQDRQFYSMQWHDWCQSIISDPPLGFQGTGWEERCLKIVRGDWPW